MGRGGNLQLHSWHCPAIALIRPILNRQFKILNLTGLKMSVYMTKIINVIMSHVGICTLHISVYIYVYLKKEAKLQNTYYKCNFNHVNFCKIYKVTLGISVSWLTVGTGALPLESVVHRLWEAVTGSTYSHEVFHWMQTTATQGGHKSLIVCSIVAHCGVLGICRSHRGIRGEGWVPVFFWVFWWLINHQRKGKKQGR